MKKYKVPGYEVWVDKSGAVFRKTEAGFVKAKLTNVTEKWKYHCVSVHKDGTGRSGWGIRTVHDLMGLAFFGPKPKGAVCRHLDGNPKNNRIENLKYGTYRENTLDTYEHGTSLLGTGRGYGWNKRQKKWLAQVCIFRKTVVLGRFDTEQEARACYVGAVWILKEILPKIRKYL